MEREGRGGEMRKERRGRRGGEVVGRRGGEMRREGRERRGIILALFLIINILMISCGNGGPEAKELKEGQAATADGRIIDLAKVGKNINEAIKFVTSVEEIETLIKSVGELAKAIGKKIQESSDALGADGAHNGSLVAGAFQVILTVKSKLENLSKLDGISSEIRTKVDDTKGKAEAFLGKLKTNHSDLGKEGATDAHAKNALDVNDGSKGKGASELKELNAAIDDLLKAANIAVDGAVKILIDPAKGV